MRSMVDRISVTASPVTGMPSRNLPISVSAGMRQRFEPRQAEEAAGALDGVDEAEDVVENLGVVRLLLETHQLDVDGVEALAGLGQELPQQIVHGTQPSDARQRATDAPFGSAASLLRKRLSIGCANAPKRRR